MYRNKLGIKCGQELSRGGFNAIHNFLAFLSKWTKSFDKYSLFIFSSCEIKCNLLNVSLFRRQSATLKQAIVFAKLRLLKHAFIKSFEAIAM